MKRNGSIGLTTLDDLLAASAALGASDLILTVGQPPTSWVDGQAIMLSNQPLSSKNIELLSRPVLNEHRRHALQEQKDLDLAYFVQGLGRFRVNAFRQKGNLALVARRVKQVIPSIDSLALPPILKKLACLQNGLVLVTGAAGAGKSTTLAAMIDHRNAHRSGHIVTIEDPIEFVHLHKRSVISQREIGTDVGSYAQALKSVLRQAPTAILLGEIRDQETADAAFHVAETGHLVLATLHAVNTVQTLNRFVDLFDSKRRTQVLALLSSILAGVISQRLVPSLNGGRRAAALEILVPTPRLRELIAVGDEHGIYEAMALCRGAAEIQTFEDSLMKLIKSGQVSLEAAIPYADSPASLKLRHQLDRLSESHGPTLSKLFKLA